MEHGHSGPLTVLLMFLQGDFFHFYTQHSFPVDTSSGNYKYLVQTRRGTINDLAQSGRL